MSPETQRRIDRRGAVALPLARHRPANLRRDVTDRRTVRPPVMSEALFQEMLVRERHRMERSHRSFALLLVSMNDSIGEDPLVVWGSIVEALSAAKRDTDVLGWLERGSVIGVALTEISRAMQQS